MATRELRLAFVTGRESRLFRIGLAAKYWNMRRVGLLYPDVYCLPLFLADRFVFLRDREPIRQERFDFIFSELNRSTRQLEYLAELVERRAPLIVVPGPPELLAEDLSPYRSGLVRTILDGARQVWAYSTSVQRSTDELLGRPVARVIPWPFDAGLIRRVAARRSGRGRPGEIRVLLHVPMSFSADAAHHPLRLRAMLKDLLRDIPEADRDRFTFHSFAYSREDRRQFHGSGYAEGFAARLQRKRGFAGFIQFVRSCDAVVNLTSGSILGRITFLSAALDRPGVFSANAELNAQLYPTSTVDTRDEAHLRSLIRELLTGLVQGRPGSRFLPDLRVVERVGDFEANATRVRAILESASSTAGGSMGGPAEQGER